MFEGDEYRSYVQLCRELRLERKAQDGDWFLGFDPDHEPTEANFLLRNDDGGGPSYADPDSDDWRCVWLPRLDQWLTMLEEMGISDVLLKHMGGLFLAHDMAIANGRGPTREEAAARLWCAVTKLAVHV